MKLQSATPVLVCLALTAAAFGQAPYPNPGTVPPAHTYTAAGDGAIIASFIDGPGQDNDRIRLYDTSSGYVSAWLAPSHETAAGTTFSLGNVFSGDNLVFEIENNNPVDANQVFASDPNISTDGFTHLYSYSLGNGLIYAGFEDIPQGFSFSGASYNDDNFLISNVLQADPIATSTPEPGSLLLLGTGVLGVAGTLRRRIIA